VSLAESARRARKVLFENAATVYGFDLSRLRPDIERIGFRLDDVRVETGSDTTEITRPIHSRPAPVGR
jgi:nucleoside-triphosphatase THEP1